MDLQDAGCRARFLIRDRDGKYPALFDTILADTSLQAILTNVVGSPRMRVNLGGVPIVHIGRGSR